MIDFVCFLLHRGVTQGSGTRSCFEKSKLEQKAFLDLARFLKKKKKKSYQVLNVVLQRDTKWLVMINWL